MSEYLSLLIVLLVGLAGGFFDSVVGSGGLITIPSLVFMGLPPQVSIATDRLGTAGQTLTALLKFWKAKKILWNYVFPFTILGIFGAYIGASLLLEINPENLEKIIGILLILVLPFIFLNKDIGVQRRVVGKLKKISGFLIYFLIMIYNGFFGTGSGPLSFYNQLFFFGFTMIEANATGIIPWFALSLSSLWIFARNGIIDYQKGIVLVIGMAVGGYIGAHVAIKKGDLWVKRVFVLVVIISSIKLLFF